MITGKKEDILCYKGLSSRIDRAIDFVLSLDKNIKPGTYEIDGKSLYVNIVEGKTSSLDTIEFEAHKEYLDLHYILSGKEIMVYAPIDECVKITEYDAENDYWLLGGKGNQIEMREDSFYLLYPNDAHCPGKGHGVSPFKKAIVKIRL